MRRDVSGCYYCIRVFKDSQITKYVDNGETPLCPYCGIDSVLEGVSCRAALRKYHNKMFGTAKQLYPKTKYGE